MYPPTPDYNQHMSAFLHAWRQFLEQCTASAGMPFPTVPSAWPMMPFMPAGGQYMPPTVSFLPPMPPMPPFMPPSMPPASTAPAPPAPADYTQQLFSYLQAWRQYLEQATGAKPVSPQAPTAQQPTADNRPASDTGGKTTAGSDVTKGSPAWPPLLDVPPENPGGSQIVSTTLGQAPPLMNLPPTSGEFVSQYKLPGTDQQGAA